MQRGRKPKSVADKAVRGNPGKRALTTAVPKPPDGPLMIPLRVANNPVALVYWNNYVENSAPGHLSPLDVPLLSLLCTTLARVDHAEQAMNDALIIRAPISGAPIQSPWLAIINKGTELARKLAAELSLSPAQRNRLGIHGGGGGGADDPNDAYF